MTEPRLGVWPPLPPGAHVRRRRRELPFPLAEPGCALFSRARHGLWQGVRALGLHAGDEVLVPAYHHGSEIEALARAGLRLRFYEAHEGLAPLAEELDSLLAPSVRALYLIHYLGFPQDAPRWRAWCDERGLFLLEDAAQAWLASSGGQPLGSSGDLSVFCLYKSFGLPDGAALVCRVPPRAGKRSSGRGLGALARRHALWLAARSGGLARIGSRFERDGEYVAGEDFALGEPASAPSRATLFLLPRLADASAAARRRANYRVLLDELADLVPSPFGELPEGASPFAFPLEVPDKAGLLERLRRSGVHALDFWSVPHPALPADAFPGAAARRERGVALPVHQELRPSDLERVVTAVRGTPPRRPQLRLEPVAGLDDAGAEWAELAERSGNVFATWEWASIWWRHFGDGRPLHLTACRSPGGEPVALLPLYAFARRPFRVLRFLGHGPADQLGPVCASDDRPTAARALRESLRELRWDAFVAEQLPGNEGWSAVLGGRVLRRTGTPVLRFDGKGWDELLAGKSRNFREQVKRRERKLAREHELRFRLSEDREGLDADLDTLFALHSERWSAGGSVFGGPTEAFHREFAACALERGWLRLWILELDGRPVAAWYGLRFAGCECYYQAGRDPAYDRHSVGFVLLVHSIRAALEDGVREYRFLRGGEDFKYRFANADPGLETLGVWRGPAGRAAVAAAALRG